MPIATGDAQTHLHTHKYCSTLGARGRRPLSQGFSDHQLASEYSDQPVTSGHTPVSNGHGAHKSRDSTEERPDKSHRAQSLHRPIPPCPTAYQHEHYSMPSACTHTRSKDTIHPHPTLPCPTAHEPYSMPSACTHTRSKDTIHPHPAPQHEPYAHLGTHVIP
jgi:hypothetical protein